MNFCDMDGVVFLRYLDGEMIGEELERFRSHLQTCSVCMARLEEERRLTQVLRQSRPLYSAPDALRSRITVAMDEASVQDRLLERLGRAASRVLGAVLHPPSMAWKLSAIGILALAACLIFVPEMAQRVRASSYVDTAVVAHRGYLSGALVPEIQTGSPEEITLWLSQRLPFHFRLPTSDTKYQVSGARLVEFRGMPAALVMYVTRTEPKERVSVIVARAESAPVAGGEEIRDGNIVFHSQGRAGFRVITWSTHGLSYALVSSISGTARHSCLVCHEETTAPH